MVSVRARNGELVYPIECRFSRVVRDDAGHLCCEIFVPPEDRPELIDLRNSNVNLAFISRGFWFVHLWNDEARPYMLRNQEFYRFRVELMHNLKRSDLRF